MKSFQDEGGSPFGGATEAELFSAMARRGEDAREAWAEFYRRYVADFHRLVCRLRGMSNAADELVQETMIRAYRSAHTYRAVEGQDREAARRRTLAWLGRIARNLYYETLRGQKVLIVADSARQGDEGGASVATEGPRIPAGELHRSVRKAEDAMLLGAHASRDQASAERRLLRDALGALPERELDILLVSYDHYEPGEEHPHLPRAVVAELCERHEVTPANLRKIRERARNQVWDYVRANSPA